MKKSILNLGTALNRREQKQVNGGTKQISVPEICGGFTFGSACNSDSDCCEDYTCTVDWSHYSGLGDDCMSEPNCFGGDQTNYSDNWGRCM